MPTLRNYQLNTLQKIVNRYEAGVKNQLIKLSTGLGKTVIFSNLKNFSGWTGKVLVIVHREELANQAADKIKQWNPDATVSVEMGDRTSFATDYVVAGIQSISKPNRLLKFLPSEFCAVVIDEAHHSAAPSYIKVLEYFRHGNLSSLRLGVTATPNRADGKGLGGLYDEIVDDYGLYAGIEDGWLVDLKCQQIRTSTNLDFVKKSFGDLNIHDLGVAVNTPTRNLEIVNGWKEFGENRVSLYYTVDVASAISLAKTFNDEGVPCDYVHGGDAKLVREAKLRCHEDGLTKVLTNCEVLTEGYDAWKISCIGMGRPTTSESLYTQIVGRGTRIEPAVGNMKNPLVPPTKTDCLVLDYTDNSDKHSLVSLSSLAGIETGRIKINGNTFTQVVKKIKQVKEEHPTLNIAEYEGDIDALQVFAKQKDLFEVKYEPEVLQYSKLKWYKTGEGQYSLLLPNKEGIKISKNFLLDRYELSGTVNKNEIKDNTDELKDALQLGDQYVKSYGGGLATVVKQSSSWHSLSPTEKQIKACKWLGINIPPGASRGDVHSKISEVMAKRGKSIR